MKFTYNLIACVFLFTLSLSADPRKERRGTKSQDHEIDIEAQHFDDREERIEGLNLSASQREAFKRFREQRKSLRQRSIDLARLRAELNRLLGQPDVKDQDILNKLKEINQANAALSEERMTGLLRLKKVLSPEQFERLIQLRSRG